MPRADDDQRAHVLRMTVPVEGGDQRTHLMAYNRSVEDLRLSKKGVQIFGMVFHCEACIDRKRL